jgi:hypothetical protein
MAADNFSFIQPMMALQVRDLPTGNWIYEMKFDGYRALATTDRGADQGRSYFVRRPKQGVPRIIRGCECLPSLKASVDSALAISSPHLHIQVEKAPNAREEIMPLDRHFLNCGVVEHCKKMLFPCHRITNQFDQLRSYCQYGL